MHPPSDSTTVTGTTPTFDISDFVRSPPDDGLNEFPMDPSSSSAGMHPSPGVHHQQGGQISHNQHHHTHQQHSPFSLSISQMAFDPLHTDNFPPSASASASSVSSNSSCPAYADNASPSSFSSSSHQQHLRQPSSDMNHYGHHSFNTNPNASMSPLYLGQPTNSSGPSPIGSSQQASAATSPMNDDELRRLLEGVLPNGSQSGSGESRGGNKGNGTLDHPDSGPINLNAFIQAIDMMAPHLDQATSVASSENTANPGGQPDWSETASAFQKVQQLQQLQQFQTAFIQEQLNLISRQAVEQAFRSQQQQNPSPFLAPQQQSSPFLVAQQQRQPQPQPQPQLPNYNTLVSAAHLLRQGLPTSTPNTNNLSSLQHELMNPGNMSTSAGAYRDNANYDQDGNLLFTPLISPVMSTHSGMTTPGSAFQSINPFSHTTTPASSLPSHEFFSPLTSPALGPNVFPRQPPSSADRYQPGASMSPHLLGQTGNGSTGGAAGTGTTSVSNSKEGRSSRSSRSGREAGSIGSNGESRNAKTRPSPLMKPVNGRKSGAGSKVNRDSSAVVGSPALLASPQIPLEGIEEMEISLSEDIEPASYHQQQQQQQSMRFSPSSLSSAIPSNVVDEMNHLSSMHSSPSPIDFNSSAMPPPPLPAHVQHRINTSSASSSPVTTPIGVGLAMPPSGPLAPQTPATFLNLSTRPNLNTTSGSPTTGPTANSSGPSGRGSSSFSLSTLPGSPSTLGSPNLRMGGGSGTSKPVKASPLVTATNASEESSTSPMAFSLDGSPPVTISSIEPVEGRKGKGGHGPSGRTASSSTRSSSSGSPSGKNQRAKRRSVTGDDHWINPPASTSTAAVKDGGEAGKKGSTGVKRKSSLSKLSMDVAIIKSPLLVPTKGKEKTLPSGKKGKPKTKVPATKPATTVEVKLPDVVKKTSHKVAEQRRRDSLKAGFDELRLLLPPINVDCVDPDTGELIAGASMPRLPARSVPDSNPNRGVSKVALLRCSNQHIETLNSRISRRDDFIEHLKKEIRSLRTTGRSLPLPLFSSNHSHGNPDGNSIHSVDIRDVDLLEFDVDHCEQEEDEADADEGAGSSNGTEDDDVEEAEVEEEEEEDEEDAEAEREGAGGGEGREDEDEDAEEGESFDLDRPGTAESTGGVSTRSRNGRFGGKSKHQFLDVTHDHGSDRERETVAHAERMGEERSGGGMDVS